MSETNIFELLLDKYNLPNKPKLFESFSGIGTQRMAFNRLGLDYEMVGISEIDKYAIKSYMAIHGETKNYGSITEIKGYDLPQIDVFTWSFPCTDLSKAGQQKGLSKETRSGLVYEVLRIINETKEHGNMPKVLIMENVVDLVQVKFIKQFQEIQLELEQLGYTNYVETLNSKNYGVAQNRDRVFMVSILGDYYYEFPKPIPLQKKLKDYLEDEVDDKYYLNDAMLKYMNSKSSGGLNRKEQFERNFKEDKQIAATITTCAGNRPSDNFIQEPVCLNSKVDGKQPSLQDRVYDSNAISTCVTTSFMPFVTIPKKTSGNDVGVVVEKNNKEILCEALLENGHLKEFDMIRHSYTNSRMDNLDRIENRNGVSAALTTRPDTLGIVVNESANLRIRKLTPLECWRLMGIDDSDYQKAQSVNSNAQLYKQAGNAIVVDVFAKIIENLK